MKLSKIAVVSTAILLFSPFVMAEKVGIVNVLDIFNQSSFVIKANKALETNAKKMDAKLQQDKANLQTMVGTFEKTSDQNAKKNLAKKIAAAQTNLSNLTQTYQKKIQEEQSAGMQKFTKILQEATQKVAKEKGLNTVVNSNTIIYTDNTWIDITSDVKAALPQD